jgi:acetyl-CoA synthetase
MRRLLREIAGGGKVAGDITTLEDLSVLEKLRQDEE